MGYRCKGSGPSQQQRNVRNDGNAPGGSLSIAISQGDQTTAGVPSSSSEGRPKARPSQGGGRQSQVGHHSWSGVSAYEWRVDTGVRLLAFGGTQPADRRKHRPEGQI